MSSTTIVLLIQQESELRLVPRAGTGAKVLARILATLLASAASGSTINAVSVPSKRIFSIRST